MKPISVSAQVEINASPATVRSIFLDFARYNQWQQGWAIEPPGTTKAGMDLQKDDVLKVTMPGMTFHPAVIENKPGQFIWEARMSSLIYGRHTFAFTPSETTPGGTTFVQSEDFGGYVMVLAWPWRNKEFDMRHWHTFNEAIKNEAEKSSSSPA